MNTPYHDTQSCRALDWVGSMVREQADLHRVTAAMLTQLAHPRESILAVGRAVGMVQGEKA